MNDPISPPTRRVAAVDVGTNTVLLVVADVDAGGRLAVVAEEERFARLGEGVDANGCLTAAAMDRVLDRLAAARATAVRLGAEAVVIGATSASRDARNTDVLVARVRDELGLDYRIISGEEEAALVFRGVLALLPDLPAACVLDIGGGSTELVAGPRARPTLVRSVDVGSVRLTERYFVHAHRMGEAPSRDAVRDADADVAAALGAFPADAFAGLPLVGAAGTARVAAALAGYGSEAVPVVSRATVRSLRDRLLALAPPDVLALDPALLAGRADVSAAAFLILDAVMERFGFEALVAGRGGLRHGLALQWADGER